MRLPTNDEPTTRETAQRLVREYREKREDDAILDAEILEEKVETFR